VHGWVKTVVGQHSRPVSIAARSLRQNSSSCFWRRARASTLPSSMTRFRFDMMPPPTIRVSVTLKLVGSSAALVEESVLDFEVLVSPVPKAHQAMWAFSGLAHGAHALPTPLPVIWDLGQACRFHDGYSQKMHYDPIRTPISITAPLDAVTRRGRLAGRARPARPARQG
jgi:hypothetical protein